MVTPAWLLTHRVAEVVDAAHLKERLESGAVLRVKLGIDPNKPKLHLGHAVSLFKLAEFQQGGHTAVLILGDFTAQLGDPTDRRSARQPIGAEETKKNADAYLKQIFRFLDPAKTEVHRNSEWFDHMSLKDTIALTATVTVNQLLRHETFAARLESNTPLHGHELLYPLLQGYDSVAVRADLELGALDQKFNVLMGRAVQRAYGQSEQDVMLFGYLPGTDGHDKMSKSLGNTINLIDSADDIFGQVMSLPDSLMPAYFSLATDVSPTELARLKRQMVTRPREIKVVLATAIVRLLCSPAAAAAAAASFDRVFRQKQVPTSAQTLVLDRTKVYTLTDVITHRAHLVVSRSELRRLVAQGGVKVNRQTVSDAQCVISPVAGGTVIQVGPRRWLKVEWRP